MRPFCILIICLVVTSTAGAADYFHWLKHGSWEQRVHAMYHLGYSGYKPSFWLLVEYLNKEFEEPNDSRLGVRVRQAAATALGKLKDDRAVQHLVERYKKEKKPRVRKAILFSLGFYDKQQIAEIVQSGLKDDSPEVQWEALQTASSLGDKAPVGAVQQFASSNDDPGVEIIASYVLYESGQEKEKNRDVMLNGLKNKDPEVRYWATHYAAKALGVEALDPIIRASEIESVYWVMKEMDDSIYRLSRERKRQREQEQLDTVKNLFREGSEKTAEKSDDTSSK